MIADIILGLVVTKLHPRMEELYTSMAGKKITITRNQMLKFCREAGESSFTRPLVKALAVTATITMILAILITAVELVKEL